MSEMITFIQKVVILTTVLFQWTDRGELILICQTIVINQAVQRS